MNIDDYRAMIAQSQKDSSQTQEGIEQPNAQTESATTSTPTPTQTQTTETPTETPKANEPTLTEQTPQKIKLGETEVTLDEIQEWQKGYLRQSDYTKKTQELSRQRKEAEEALKIVQSIKQNPDLAKQIADTTQIQSIDPAQSRIMEIEHRMYDMMLEQEINLLSSKYSDFDVTSVLQLASDKNLTNLEDAYLLYKATQPQTVATEKTPITATSQPQTFDINELTKQITEQVRAELKAEQSRNTDTSTIITSQSTSPVRDDSPVLSDAEKRIAKHMRMTDEEYAKWRDMK